MKRLLSFLTLALLICAGAWAQATAETQRLAALEVINDFMGSNPGLTVNVTINPSLQDNGKDKFTYTLSGTTLSITASNGVAACRGFYDFVKSNGAGICSWSANRFKAPNSYTTTTKTVTSPYRDHQYLNVVTYGYSMPYWNADRWDKEINWMALHGIDMPLMLVGSETIYRDVFKALYNTTSSQLDEWEVGPATLPWMRMGNLAGNSFDGPLGEHWHTTQKALAKHILERMGKLGMKPVVPAFGGFVPPAVAQQLGGATQTGWGWVPNEYKNYRLTPTAGTGGQDGDFKKIGKKFIELWDAEYESSYGSEFKYYLSDSFNEMTVPNDASVLQTYGEQIYSAIKEGSGNNDAVWVTQGWEFVYGSGKWTNGSTSDAKYKALTASVPQGKFMSLYMSPEYGNGKWSSYDNFDGDDWVYTMLPNMGGKNFWTGNLNNYAQSWPKSMAQSGAKNNCTGWGMTMEGIEYNELLYELIADMGWTDPATGKVLNDWIAEYGNARYGTAYTTGMQNLINTLRNTVYTSYIDHANFGWQGNNKSSGYYNAGNINTVNDTFFEGFETFFNDDNIGELRTIAENSGLDETLRADLIEYAAFYAAARVEKICKRITTANNTGNKTLANELIGKLDKVMTDMDYILTGHPIYDEAKWEQKARTLANGNTDAEKKYVKNARRIVTTWYGNHQSHEAVNDYASRIYAGIIRDYYLPRLKAELNQLVNGTPCNLRDIERTFTPNGNVSTDAPALSAPGYYLGNDEKTTVADGMTTTNTSDAVLLANIQALVEEAQEAGEIIIEKNNLTVSTDAETHWYFVNSNNPSYTDRSLTETSVDGVKSTVKAQTTEASNEQIWRFVDNHDGTVRMENRNGQTLTWENGTAKTYIANINASMTYEKDEANTRYALMPESMSSGKALHMNSNDGVPIEYGYKDAGTTNYYAGSTWTLSNADSYIGVPSDEDFARITRRFQGFQTSVWGTGSYGSVGQPKSAAALQAAIDAVATRDLALDTYTDYLATYDTALKANFTLPTDAEALKLFDLIISAFQIDPNVNCNTEDQATFKTALQTAQTALANGATGNTASAAATTLEAAVKTFITNSASFPYVSKAPANGQFDANSKVVTMKVKNAGYITTASVDTQSALTLGNKTKPSTNVGYWIVCGNDATGYTFYNVGAGATKVLGMTGSEGNARAKIYDVNSTSGVTTQFLYKKNQNGDHCFYISGNNAWNNRNNYLALWNDAKAFGTDNGSAIEIALVESEIPQPAEGDWTESDWTACSTAQTTNFKAAAYYDAKTVTIGSASTRKQVRAKAGAVGNNTVTVTVKFSSGTHAQALYGVQLLAEDGSVAYETSYELYTLGTSATKTYTLNNVAEGTYTVRIWSAATKGNETMTATGTVEVSVNGNKDGDTMSWNNTNWNIENTAVPAAVQSLVPSVGITLNQGNAQTRTYYYMDKQMTFTKATSLTATITNNDDNTDLDLIGVELLKDGNLVTTAGTYDGHYSDGETNNTYTVQVPSAGNYTVRAWASYVPAKAPANGDAEYDGEVTLDNITETITYTYLTDTSCWSTWNGTVPTGISNLGTSYNATNLRVIEKTYMVTEPTGLQSTFQWSGGNHRTDIVGVDVLDSEGLVVDYDYRAAYSGGGREKIVYNVEIPAGTYTVRYITTASSTDGANTNTKGTITNAVFTYNFDSDKLYTIHEPDDSRGYMAYNPADNTYVGLADVTLNGYQNKHANTSNANVGIAFKIIESPAGTVKFYCEKNSSYVKFDNNNSGSPAKWTTTASEASTFTYTKQGNYYLFQPTGSSYYLNPFCGYEANQGPVRLGAKEGCTDWDVKEYIPALQNRHLYTIKGAFSDGSFAPVVCNNNVITAGAATDTPEVFVFFETTHTNNAGLTPVFNLGTVEGNGYFHYNANGTANTTKAYAAAVAFPTSKTTLATGWSFEGGGFKEGYFGMVGLSGTTTYRSYAVKPSTNINFNTRDNTSKISASNSLGATSAWGMNYVIEEMKGYDVYDIIVQGSATVAYQGTEGNCLTTVAQGNGGYLVVKSDVTLSESDFNVTGLATGSSADITIDNAAKKITVKSIDNVSDVINYIPLDQTSCWNSWGDRAVPAEITANDANCTSANLRVIEKNYVFTEKCALQATFKYTSGNKRTDIVGVEVLDSDGYVVAHDYHFGYTGSGTPSNNVYTVIVPGADTYTVRYISTVRSADGANINTNGTITNALISPYYKIPGTYYMYIQDGDKYLMNGKPTEDWTHLENAYQERGNAYVWRVVSDGTNITLTNGQGNGYKENASATEVTSMAIADIPSTWNLIEIPASKIWNIDVRYAENGYISYGTTPAYNGGFFVTAADATNITTSAGEVEGWIAGHIANNEQSGVVEPTLTLRYYTEQEEEEMPYLARQINEAIGNMLNGSVGYAPFDYDDLEAMDPEIAELIISFSSVAPEYLDNAPAEYYRETLAAFNQLAESKKDDIIMPQAGQAFRLSVRSSNGHNRWYLTNDGGVSSNKADAAIFVMGSTGAEGYGSLFVTNDNTASKYLRNNGATASSYAANKCDFEVETMLKKSNQYITTDMAHRFGTFSLKAKERNNNSWEGALILRESNQSWDGSTEPYMNGTLSSAIEMEEVEYPYTKPNFTCGSAGDGHEGGYATIWLPFPMHFASENIQVYKGTVENEDRSLLLVEQVNGTQECVAAGGYILYDPSLKENTPSLVLPAAAAPEDMHDTGDAVFKGSTEDPENADNGTMWSAFVNDNNLGTGDDQYTAYVLGKKTQGIGLYRYTGTTFPKGKAIWLKPNATASSECVKFGFDDIISAIDALNGNAMGSEIYDLQGHRLDKAVKGQVNVINGKKIMFK